MVQKSYKGAAVAAKLTGSMSSGALSLNLDVSTGWPDGITPALPFVLTVGRGTASEEKMLCSSRSGLVVTVASTGRGYDGTTASSHVAGENVEHTVDAATLTDMSTHVFSPGADDHTQYLKVDGSRAPTGSSALVSDPVASAVGDTMQRGAAATLANGNHRHAREGAGVPVGVGTTNAQGSAATVALSDHVHAGLPRTGCTLDRSSVSIPTGGGGTTLLWTSEPVDTDGFIVADGTHTNIVVPAGKGGLYSLSVDGTFATFGISEYVFINVVVALKTYQFPVPNNSLWGGTWGISLAAIPMVAGDSVSVTVFQNHGSAVNLVAHIDMYRVGL